MTRTSSILWIVLATGCVFTIVINLLFHNLIHLRRTDSPTNAFSNFKSNFLLNPKKIDMAAASSQKKEQNVETPTKQQHIERKTETVQLTQDVENDQEEMKQQEQHVLAGLSCKEYGGPMNDEEVAQEMVYWSDIPSDSNYASPLKRESDDEKYLTFEPDGGGWNNIRMAMETVVVMAHAMGRTLVIPPQQGMYLLRKDKGKQRIHFSFADFFHLDSIDVEHQGLNIISMEEFLKRTAMKGKLVNVTSQQVSFPPYNRTDWNGQDPKELKEYLRDVTHVRNWKPDSCVAVFPKQADSDLSDWGTWVEEFRKSGNKPDNFIGNPTPVDAPPKERLSETISGRSRLCFYDEEMQKAPVVHFMCYHKQRARLLTHFYSFLFFEDWKQDLWSKRFVRDHLRYLDELQCAAARVVAAVRERARKKNPEKNPKGLFDSFHVRRGDFQFKDTRVEADVLYEISKDQLEEGSTIYISTDERKKKIFFKPLTKHYDICFLSDFEHLFKGLNSNYYGMLDQLIASKGRIFFGTFYSTFTGYINRMRGYYITKHKLDGYEDGTMKSYYFYPPHAKDVMTTYFPLHGPYWAREYPTSWRDIDKGIEELDLESMK